MLRVSIGPFTETVCAGLAPIPLTAREYIHRNIMHSDGADILISTN